METLLKDIRYAVAMMRRNKGFTTAALLTLALGIGATTAVFSVVYGVLLRPLPYPAAERLVRLSEETSRRQLPAGACRCSATLTYYAWGESRARTDQTRSRPPLTAAVPWRFPTALARAGGHGDITPTLFPMIGATPALGRFFQPDEGAPEPLTP